MYYPLITNQCKKDIKKLDFQIQKFIRYKIFPKILKNPYIGKPLKSNFKNFWKFKFKHLSTDYRIIYEIKNKELIIIFIMTASRENLYKKLKQRI